MSKWQKIDPAEINVGDLVKVRHAMGDYEETTSAVANYVTDQEIGVGPYNLYKDQGTWYIAKPKKPQLSHDEKEHFALTMPKPFPPPGFAPDATNASDELADGHSAHYWYNKYAKQLNHNERLQAVSKGRAAKLKEAEARLALKLEEIQSQLDDAMMTIDRKNSELTNLRRVFYR